MSDHDIGFFWRSPSEPSAIALLSLPARPDFFDRALPQVGSSRFALLIDAHGNVLDEVVVTSLPQGGSEVACHGGAGVRQRVSEGLMTHGLKEMSQDPFAESDHWHQVAQCAHPAALRLGLSSEHPFWNRIPNILITGPSNAGKSTLLNAWVGHQRALAGPLAGTTRDLVHAQVQCFGWNLQLTDSAGLRETSDDIEAAGQSLVVRARETADLVLFCQPPSQVDSSVHAGDLRLFMKADLHRGGTENELCWAAEPHVEAQQSEAYLHTLIAAILRRLNLPLPDTL